MKKIIAIIMLAAMVLTAVACGTTSGPAQGTDPVTTAPSAVTTDAPVTEPPKFVHSGNTYDQADFIILVSSLAPETFNDFKYNETEPTVLDNAVQQKNMACEEPCTSSITSTMPPPLVMMSLAPAGSMLFQSTL